MGKMVVTATAGLNDESQFKQATSPFWTNATYDIQVSIPGTCHSRVCQSSIHSQGISQGPLRLTCHTPSPLAIGILVAHAAIGML